jgi:hypothetical protein
MTEPLAELQQLLAEVGAYLWQGRRRLAIAKLRKLASAASTLALTLECNPHR